MLLADGCMHATWPPYCNRQGWGHLLRLQEECVFLSSSPATQSDATWLRSAEWQSGPYLPEWQLQANLVEPSLIAPSDILGALSGRHISHISTCQEDEDVPWQVVLVQADGCLHCSRDIVAHRLLRIVHLQALSARLAGEASARRPTDAAWTALPALLRQCCVKSGVRHGKHARQRLHLPRAICAGDYMPCTLCCLWNCLQKLSRPRVTCSTVAA